MKIQTALLVTTALLAAVACVDKTPASSKPITGVWANADCELLRTDRFARPEINDRNLTEWIEFQKY